MKDNNIPIIIPNKLELPNMLNKIPVESISEIIDSICYVAKTDTIIKARYLEFEKKLQKIKANNDDRYQRMDKLINLIQGMNFSEQIQIRLIESICKIAEC